MPFTVMLLIGTASAVPVIDTSDLEGLKRSGFESHETGWFALSAEWAQRIYVGETELEVEQWFHRMQTQYYKQKLEKVEGEWDEGLGNDAFLMVRVNQMGLLCQGDNAALCMSHLQSRIVNIDPKPGCSTPEATLTEQNAWVINSTCQYNFQGGQPMYHADAVLFETLPNAIVVYNQYAHSWRYTLTDAATYVLQEPHIPPISSTSEVPSQD